MAENTAGSNIRIGAYDSNFSNAPKGMAYDEVRLVKRALTPQEFIMPPTQAETFLAAAAAQAKARQPVVTDDTLVYAPCDDAFLTHGSEMNALAGADGKPALTLTLDDTSNTVMWASSAETGNYAATAFASGANATTGVRGRVSRAILARRTSSWRHPPETAFSGRRTAARAGRRAAATATSSRPSTTTGRGRDARTPPRRRTTGSG